MLCFGQQFHKNKLPLVVFLLNFFMPNVDTSIVCPIQFQIARYDGEAWYFKQLGTIYNPLGILLPGLKDLGKLDKIAYFGMSRSKLKLEFRLLNGGAIGYYLADLQNRNYYYCGLEWADVKTTFQKLGIGKKEPED